MCDVYTDVCVHTCMDVCMYVCMCVYVWMYVCVHTCMPASCMSAHAYCTHRLLLKRLPQHVSSNILVSIRFEIALKDMNGKCCFVPLLPLLPCP